MDFGRMSWTVLVWLRTGTWKRHWKFGFNSHRWFNSFYCVSKSIFGRQGKFVYINDLGNGGKENVCIAT